ncbi:MAG: cyclic nucleotide-binding domain-containing protein [Bacteroidetes bacterium]|nr:cyclic nucleotide-binding domain-containing protein [Bacteroidota bacterium]
MEQHSFDITRVLLAAALAGGAMISLILGTAVGVYARPTQRTNAIIMAFGTGALIQALSIELAMKGAHRLETEALLSGVDAWMWVASGFLLGGLIYYLANKWLEKRGAAVRHPALAKFYYLRQKQKDSGILLNQLSKVELVRSLPPEEMDGVLTCVEPIDVSEGEVLFRQGEPGNALYLIDSGTIDIINDADGERTVIATLGAGQSFGEMALLNSDRRTATAVAMEQSRLLRIGKDQFDALMEISPGLRKAVEALNSRRILQNVQNLRGERDTQHWKKVAASNINRLSRAEELTYMKKSVTAGNPLALFLGAMLDTIPESIIIGAGFYALESYSFTFLLAVFLSNLPEAMGSSMNMLEAGFSKAKIFGLWIGLVVAGIIAAALGNIFLLDAPATVISFVEAVAGGGILAMLASVMMPEAYEDGGAEVGLATIVGFLSAMFFTLW